MYYTINILRKLNGNQLTGYIPNELKNLENLVEL